MDKIKLYPLLKYSLMAFPLSFAGLPIYLHAPALYATEFAVPIGYIGLALLGLRFFDAVQDPLIGAFSDRFHERRSTVIIIASLLLCGGFWMLFNPYAEAPLTWFCAAVIICTTGFSVLGINLQALGGLWHVRQESRAKIMTSREAVGLLGLLTASLVPTLLMRIWTTEEAFFWLSLSFPPLMLVALWALLSWMKKAKLSVPEKTAQTSVRWADIIAIPPVRRFFFVYLLSGLAASLPAVLIIFFVRDYLLAENFLGIFLAIYFLSGIAAMPVWNYAARRTSALKAWWWSMLIACAGFIWAYFLSPGDTLFYGLICATSGIAVGANLALPSVIAADLFRLYKQIGAAARYYAVLAFLGKAALALASGLALPMLGYFGYIPGQADDSRLLPMTYALFPCIVQLLAIIFLWKLVKQKKGHRYAT